MSKNRKQRLKTESANISPNTTEKLVKSMEDRLREVIKAEDYATKYRKYFKFKIFQFF